MFTIYLSYLRAFRKYANAQLNAATEFSQIGSYAAMITEKANELLRRAAQNIRINIAKLQREMFEAGSVYIKKFAFRFRTPRFRPPGCEDYYFSESDPAKSKFDTVKESLVD